MRIQNEASIVVDFLRTRLDQAQFVRHLVREIVSLTEIHAAQVSSLEKHLEDARLQKELEVFSALEGRVKF